MWVSLDLRLGSCSHQIDMADPLELVSGIQQAKDAGYTPDEIYGHLAQRPEFAQAKEAGYSFDEVYQHLYSGAQKKAVAMSESATGIGTPVGGMLAELSGGLKVDPLTKDMHEFLDTVPPDLEKKMVDTINAHTEEDWKKEVGPVMADQLRQHYAQRAQGVSDADQPLVYLPKPSGDSAAAALTRGVEQSAEGLVTLKNIGILGATAVLPKPLQKVVGAAFLAMMGKGVAEDAATALDSTKTKSERLEATGRGIAGAAMVGLGVKEFARPSEGGATPAERSGTMTQEQADAATTQNQLRSLAPQTAQMIEPKPQGQPEMLDGLTLARRKVVEGFADAPLEQQKARQQIIDHIDDTLLSHDKDAVRASEARTAQPQPSTPTPESPATEGVQASPQAEGGRSKLFAQAAREAGAPLTAEAVESSPPPQVESEPAPAAGERTVADEKAGSAEVEPTRQSPMDQLKALNEDLGEAPHPGEKMVSDLQKLGRVNRDPAKSVASELKYYSDEERQQLQEHLGTEDAEPDTLAKAITGKPKIKETSRPSDYVDEPAGKEGRGHPTANVAKEAFGEDYTGGPGAMGPREAEAMRQAQATTGLKKATVLTERLTRGEQPLPDAERQSETEAVSRAMETQDRDPMAARNLVARILDKGDTAISRDEAAGLLVERNRVTEDMRQADARLNNPDASPLERTEAQENLRDLETQIDRLDRAQKEAGSQWGRVGRMYQRMIREDYSLEGIQRKMRTAKGGPLTEEERAQSAKLAEGAQKAIDAQEKATAARVADQEKDDLKYFYEQTIKDLTKEAAKVPKVSKPVLDIAQKIVDRWKADADEARKSLRARLGRASAGVDPTIVLDVARIMRAHVGEIGLDLAKVSARVLEDFGDAVKPYLKDAWKKTKDLIESESTPPAAKEAVKKGIGVKEKTTTDIAAKAKAEATAGEKLSHQTVYESAKAHAKAGVRGEDALMAAVHKDMQKAYPTASERDVRRAFVEYGKEVASPSRDAVETALAEAKSLVKIQEDIDQLKAGEDTWKSQNRRDPTDEIRRKTKIRDELLKKVIKEPTEGQLKSREQSKITALENRIADIDKELRTGERSPESAPLPDSPAVEQLKAERDAMQEKLNDVRGESEPKPTSEEIAADKAQKGVDAAAAALDRWDRILKGELEPESKTPREPLSNLEEEMRSQVEAMKQAAADIRRDQWPKTDPEVAQLKALEKSIADYERRVKEMDFTPKSEKQGPDTKAIAEAKAARDAAKTAYEELKKAQRPKPTPEESYNKRRMTQVAKQIADLEDRLKTGNLEKEKPVLLKKTAEVAAAEAKLTEVRREVDKAIEKKKYEQLSPQQKLFKEAVSTFRSITAIKILGHGSVGMVTHAGGLIFRPSRATIYWKNFGRQFGMWASPEFHEQLIHRLKSDPEFGTWKKAGASIDPEKTYTDYGMYAQWLGKLGEAGGRGFDALKLVRMELNKADWKSVPDEIKSDPQQADAARKLIAEINNKATGSTPKISPVGKTVEEGFYGLAKNPVLEAAFFAPRLYASRWGRVLFDPVKTVRTLMDPQSSPAERFAANKKLKNAAEFTGVLVGALLTNQAILHATGSDQNVNLTDPTKSDWLKFKGGGKTITADGGLLDPVRLLGQVMWKDLLAERTRNEQYRDGTRFKMAVDTVGNYLRGKLAPPVGLATDVATGSDFQGRPLPWSKDKPQFKDQTPYTWGEWLLDQGPIPLEGAAKEVADELKKQGFKDHETEVILKAAMTFGLGMAGVHVGEDYSSKPKASGYQVKMKRR